MNEAEFKTRLQELSEQQMKLDQERKVRNFRELNKIAKKGAILFTGSSLMELFPICEIAQSRGVDKLIYNRGIGGFTTDDFLREIDTVLLDLAPSKVFINIGTNDMSERKYGPDWIDRLMTNYEKILTILKEKLPKTEVYMLAWYPANLHLPWQTPESIQWMQSRTVENIAECNRRAEALAGEMGFHFINCNVGITDEKGEQKQEFAIDGVHMWANAYFSVFDALKEYL